MQSHIQSSQISLFSRHQININISNTHHFVTSFAVYKWNILRIWLNLYQIYVQRTEMFTYCCAIIRPRKKMQKNKQMKIKKNEKISARIRDRYLLCEQCISCEHHDWRVFPFFISIIRTPTQNVNKNAHARHTTSSQLQLFCFLPHCCSHHTSHKHDKPHKKATEGGTACARDRERRESEKKWLDDFDLVICRFCILFIFRLFYFLVLFISWSNACYVKSFSWLERIKCAKEPICVKLCSHRNTVTSNSNSNTNTNMNYLLYEIRFRFDWLILKFYIIKLSSSSFSSCHHF